MYILTIIIEKRHGFESRSGREGTENEGERWRDNYDIKTMYLVMKFSKMIMNRIINNYYHYAGGQ